MPLLVLGLGQLLVELLDLLVLWLQGQLGMLYPIWGLLDQLKLKAGRRGLQAGPDLSVLSPLGVDPLLELG